VAPKGTRLLVYNKKTDFRINIDSHNDDISKVMISFDISCLQIGGGLKTLMTKKNIFHQSIFDNLNISLMV